ncbi:MAG: epoxyalkane--coenzyme M transferase, partial [Chloroflexi bacterium]|nr:epoxyalkane--coenzyme M transferase [Chloroflexota bacterium]
MTRPPASIITTHCGSLPRPADLLPLLAAEEVGESVDEARLQERIARSVAEVVERQVQTGLDVINDGEHSKMSFTTYTASRLGGLEQVSPTPAERAPTRDALQFPDVYAEMRVMNAARPSNVRKRRARPALACTGPITYTGQARVDVDIANLRRAMGAAGARQGFMTALSPTNIAPHYPSLYYRTEEEYL